MQLRASITVILSSPKKQVRSIIMPVKHPAPYFILHLLWISGLTPALTIFTFRFEAIDNRKQTCDWKHDCYVISRWSMHLRLSSETKALALATKIFIDKTVILSCANTRCIGSLDEHAQVEQCLIQCMTTATPSDQWSKGLMKSLKKLAAIFSSDGRTLLLNPCYCLL